VPLVVEFSEIPLFGQFSMPPVVPKPKFTDATPQVSRIMMLDPSVRLWPVKP
jgi:hypothetical protein